MTLMDLLQRISDLAARVSTLEGRSPSVLDLAGAGGAAAGGALLRVTAGGPGLEYTADVYGNGDQATATETGVTVRIVNLDSSQTVPVGTWLHGATLLESKYRATLPVWLEEA